MKNNELIARGDAIEAIENVTWYHQNRNKDMVEGANSDEHQAWYKSQDIYEALEALPSVDRPQGEWIGVEEDWRHQIEFWKCSECDFAVSSMYNYCPNCGARMKGADE